MLTHCCCCRGQSNASIVPGLFQEAEKIPNMSALAKAGMPTGRGRKGGEPPRKRNKSTAPETRVPFNPTTCSSANPPISTAYSHAATIANVSTRNTAGKVCNVIVTQTSLQNPAFKERPFKLHFISGNILRCAGCKGQYPKPALPPNNLCIQHEEWQQITFPNSPSPSMIFGNVYYHTDMSCVRVNWPGFMPAQLEIPPNVRSTMLIEHWTILMQAFGVGVCS